MTTQSHPDDEAQLRRRLRGWTWFFIVGLVVSGATAIPLETELSWMAGWLGVADPAASRLPNREGSLRASRAVFRAPAENFGADTTAQPGHNAVISCETRYVGARSATPVAGVLPNFRIWIQRVWLALREINTRFPFMAYGTDWLAFGHFVIALFFVDALREPVRNRWLYDAGLLACALVIPFALVMGQIRGIPFGWRLIDCSFGVFGAIPLWLCRRYACQLENVNSIITATCSKI